MSKKSGRSTSSSSKAQPKIGIGNAEEVVIPGRARFVAIGSQEDEETRETPRVPVKRPSGSRRPE